MKKKSVFKIAGASLCVLLSASLLFACGKKEETYEPETTTTATTAAPVIPTNVNPLTGIADLAESAIGKRPTCIMVENSPDARPQWGLCTPDIVIEGEVEGGITRMMWMYADVSTAPKIGPTRSARHDYVELAEGFDAVYVHFGGSNIAYNTISNDGVNDIDGMTSGSYFARDKSRNVASEHTAYTTGENLTKAIADKGYRTDIKSDYASPFSFSSEKRTLTGGACNSVLAVFSDSYKHTFTYNSNDGLYYNHMNSSEMKDADGNTMAVTNVIILYTAVTGPIDASKHVDWDLTSGDGVYVSNGTYENIKWSKGDASSPLKLKSADGTELKLNQGKSWIGFVRTANKGLTVVA